MNACDRNSGQRLLDGELSPAEESAVLEHLNNCRQCQSWLEQAAGEADEWSTTRELLASSAERARWTPAGLEPCTVTQPLARAGHGSSEPAPLVDLSFLSPSDDPAYLGRVGPYEIVGVIGQGGMGVVLKAVDRSLSRHVAIKVLSPMLAGAGASRQRFAREARAMAALSHEHVVPIYAVDEHRGIPYFAMEYVPGGTLAGRLAQQGPLEVVATVRIAMQTALALRAAHDSGLVHRDIKPANILLDRGVERVRVTDFGLVRVASEASETASGMLAGTPQFMSPEQINHDSCDGRADLFSLGGVMYAMCTGHAPFRAESVFAVLQRIVHDEPRPIRQINPNVPRWLEGFIARLMAKDRQSRFQSAEEVAELLERELAHLQSPASTPAPVRPWLSLDKSSSGRARSFRRRVATVAATAVAIGLAAIVLAAMGLGPGTRVTPPGSDAPAPRAVDLGSAATAWEPPTTPLWNADGIEEALELANRLESAPPFPPMRPLDSWSDEISELQLRVERLNRDTSALTFPQE